MRCSNSGVDRRSRSEPLRGGRTRRSALRPERLRIIVDQLPVALAGRGFEPRAGQDGDFAPGVVMAGRTRYSSHWN